MKEKTDLNWPRLARRAANGKRPVRYKPPARFLIVAPPRVGKERKPILDLGEVAGKA